jgi:hypothetical protein
MEPGDFLEFKGRYFRVRNVREIVRPTDYHITRGQMCFGPWSTVKVAGPNAWDKKIYHHLCEIDALSFAMLKALAEKGVQIETR